MIFMRTNSDYYECHKDKIILPCVGANIGFQEGMTLSGKLPDPTVGCEIFLKVVIST